MWKCLNFCSLYLSEHISQTAETHHFFKLCFLLYLFWNLWLHSKIFSLSRVINYLHFAKGIIFWKHVLVRLSLPHTWIRGTARPYPILPERSSGDEVTSMNLCDESDGWLWWWWWCGYKARSFVGQSILCFDQGPNNKPSSKCSSCCVGTQTASSDCTLLKLTFVIIAVK
jgi:hypothetical protein